MRMIKLARRWTALQDILAKMVMSLEGIGVFTILLLLFMYIFSLLGMQIFANYSYVDIEGNAILKEELAERFLDPSDILIPIRTSFDNIWKSMNTIFVIMQADGWNIVMYQNILPNYNNNWPLYSLFFCVTFVLGNKVMLSLFTAILLSNFEGGDDSEDEAGDKKMNRSETAVAKSKFKALLNKDVWLQVYNDFREVFGYRPTVGDEKERKRKKKQ